MEYEKLIREKAVKPVRNVAMFDQPLTLRVEFENGEVVQFRDDLKLRLFFAAVQLVTFERIDGDTSHCIRERIGFFKLFGFEPGDAVCGINNDVSFSILFTPAL